MKNRLIFGPDEPGDEASQSRLAGQAAGRVKRVS
jgi:hypothetical protein